MPPGLNKSVLLVSYFTDNDQPQKFLITSRFTNSTTIEFKRFDTTSITNSIEWQVVEFVSGVRVQHFKIDLTVATALHNQAINPVILSKSFPIISILNTGDVLYVTLRGKLEYTFLSNCLFYMHEKVI